MSSYPSVRGAVVTKGFHASFLRWLDGLRDLTVLARDSSTPPGAIQAYLPSALPSDGWLLCNGQTVSKATYAALYEAIGGGFGETSTTFNLPDLRDRFLVGAQTIARAATGGASTVTLSVGNLPAHTHTITDPGHQHTDLTSGSLNVTVGPDGPVATFGASEMTSTDATGITVDSTGSGTPFSITPPAMGVQWIIKT